jgi:propionyl-CoA carboxylase alpha chain
VFYDSLIAKVISVGNTRTEAINRMLHALDKMSILGLTTNKDFLKELLKNTAFINGSFDTKLIENQYTGYKRNISINDRNESAIAIALFEWNQRASQETVSRSLNGWRNLFYKPPFIELEIADEKLKLQYTYLPKNAFNIQIEEEKYRALLLEISSNGITCLINNHRKTFLIASAGADIFVQPIAGNALRFKKTPRFIEPGNLTIKGGYIAPMPGEIIKVLVKPGEVVKSGKGLLVMSSMKMETTIEAHTDGEVEDVFVSEKMFVEANAILLKMKS